VFVAPMFNASKTLSKMLHSIFGQSYENWRVILTDDVSNNDDLQQSMEIIQSFYDILGSQNAHKLKFYGNIKKKWEVENVLIMIRKDCMDDDIVCRIDADDYLCDLDALRVINETYQTYDPDCLWTAHRWFDDKRITSMNISGPMPDNADPYTHPWVSSHLKTFRKNVFNQVKDENFRGQDGEYIRRAGDQAIYLPLLKLAKKRMYLPMVTYAYKCNLDPETFQTDDAKFQREEAEFLRKRGFIS
jgi:glycosyltransferase involved in cell wall biosynthesis